MVGWAHARPGGVGTELLHWSGPRTEIDQHNPEAVEAFARLRNSISETLVKVKTLQEDSVFDLNQWRELEAALGVMFAERKAPEQAQPESSASASATGIGRR